MTGQRAEGLAALQLGGRLTLTTAVLLQARPVNKVTVVVCTGDRGLCGGYNQKMLKLSEKRVAYVPPLP